MEELQVCTSTLSLALVLFALNVGIVVVSTSDVEMQLAFEKSDK
jgi:hypothetical protein